MWFKQAVIFQLDENFHISTAELNEKMAVLAFRPCMPSMPSSMGWAAPVDEPEAPFAQVINGYTMVCLQIEEKILPADVIRQELAKKIKEIENNEARKVRQKEKYEIKDQLVATLLPRAFTKLARIYAYIDPKNNWLIVGTTQEKKVEKLISMFSKTLNMEVSPVIIEKLSYTLTHWLTSQSYSSSFAIEKSCVLQDLNQQNRVVRCQQQDLFANSIQSLLKDGHYVKQLALSWQDRVKFVLVDGFKITGIKFEEEIIAQSKEMEAGTIQQQFIADFLIMSATLSLLIKDLYDVLQKDDSKQKLVA
ncbi:MAG TPA: recombination-associated protein RdgC [Gammaproteobacteria bacterium]|nr:recombination-associated protein RdgC [Gammaproteobacteria bacterium]